MLDSRSKISILLVMGNLSIEIFSGPSLACGLNVTGEESPGAASLKGFRGDQLNLTLAAATMELPQMDAAVHPFLASSPTSVDLDLQTKPAQHREMRLWKR